jgi:hypothetical protein
MKQSRRLLGSVVWLSGEFVEVRGIKRDVLYQRDDLLDVA